MSAIVWLFFVAIPFLEGSLMKNVAKLRDNPGLPLILTPLIESNQISRAQNQAEVQFNGFRGAKSYSGYFTVDKRYYSNLFFWYFPAQNGDAAAPTVLWLQGQLGQTSLVGLFAENGPFSVKSKHGLLERKYSWSQTHSVVYLDGPSGAGFSFTNSSLGYSTSLAATAEQLFAALKQLFALFPGLSKNDLYIAGEGYACKMAAALGVRVLKDPDATKAKLRGLMVGNGFCDPINQLDYGDYLYQAGLVDWKGLARFQEAKKTTVDQIQAKKWGDAYASFDAMVQGHAATPTLFKNLTGFDYTSNFLLPENNNSQLDYIAQYLGRNDVRAAIHVGNATLNAPAGEVERRLREDFMESAAPLIAELLASCRILFYSGQLDVLHPYTLTLNFLRNLDFPSKDAYGSAIRDSWFVDGALAGYSKRAGNLTEILVRDAGYMAASSQPEWVFDLMMRFVNGKSFASLRT